MLIRLPALCIAMSFATAALAQDEGDDIFPQGPSPALDISPECIIRVLQQTFGASADIMTGMPGIISAMVIDNYNLAAADVSLDEQGNVLGFSTTLRIGPNEDNGLAPQGTAYLDYTFNGDIGYHLAGGLNQSVLQTLTMRLDSEFRSCGGAPSLLVG